jgi:hypothetical protein
METKAVVRPKINQRAQRAVLCTTAEKAGGDPRGHWGEKECRHAKKIWGLGRIRLGEVGCLWGRESKRSSGSNFTGSGRLRQERYEIRAPRRGAPVVPN